MVGVSHFMRMLNRAVEDLKAGRVFEGEEEITDVSIELPIPSYIPDSYVVDSKQKISASYPNDYFSFNKCLIPRVFNIIIILIYPALPQKPKFFHTGSISSDIFHKRDQSF